MTDSIINIQNDVTINFISYLITVESTT